MPERQRRPIAWSDSTGFRLPSIVVRSLDRFQQTWNGGHKTYRTFIRNFTNALIRLPDEILLLITSFLSPVSRLLLSLSSKRLRVILTSHFDLSLADADQKLEFLLLLERDLPDYLTCRPCAWMFKWRSRKFMGYQCPRSYKSEYMRHHPTPKALCFFHRIYMGREMIDLILRAHYRGPSHGLPASCIDHECDSDSFSRALWFRRRLEGRMVSGEFFFARSYVSVGSLSISKDYLGHTLEFVTCVHSNSRLISEIVLNTRNWDRQQTLELGTMKCNICATDIKTKVYPWLVDRLIRVEADIWQNYGSFWSDKRAVPTLFSINNAKLDNSGLSWRDLERDFVVSKRIDNTDEDGRA